MKRLSEIFLCIAFPEHLKSHLRGTVTVCGGSNFVLITYKDAPIQDAIQDEVNALREHCPDLVPQITVCTGYTECSSGGVTAAQLIAQADEKLYVAKEIYHGRKSLVEQGS